MIAMWICNGVIVLSESLSVAFGSAQFAADLCKLCLAITVKRQHIIYLRVKSPLNAIYTTPI